MLSMITVGAVMLGVFFVTQFIVTKKLLHKHQKEWYEIKSALPQDFDTLFDNYYKFVCDIPSHPVLGKCIPRF